MLGLFPSGLVFWEWGPLREGVYVLRAQVPKLGSQSTPSPPLAWPGSVIQKIREKSNPISATI